MQPVRIASLIAVLTTFLAASALAQTPAQGMKRGGMAVPPPINNQFNLPAYSPSLMPCSPSLGTPMQGGQSAHSQQPPRHTHSHPIAPLQVAYFCPPLGGYFPALQHCPTAWVPIHPERHRQ